MVQLTHHGGAYSCCGMSHLANFNDPVPSRDAFHALIENRIDQILNRRHFNARAPENKDNHLFEAVLTDAQMTAGWDRVLKDYGFRLVTRFYNSNSGAYCNVLHYSPTRTSRRQADVPYNWNR